MSKSKSSAARSKAPASSKKGAPASGRHLRLVKPASKRSVDGAASAERSSAATSAAKPTSAQLKAEKSLNSKGFAREMFREWTYEDRRYANFSVAKYMARAALHGDQRYATALFNALQNMVYQGPPTQQKADK